MRLAQRMPNAASAALAVGTLAGALFPAAFARQPYAGSKAETPGVVVRIRSADGYPLAAALAEIVRAEPVILAAGQPLSDPACHPHCGRHAISRADGTLRFDNLQAEFRYTIYLEAKSCLAKAVVVEPKMPARVLEIVLPRKAPLLDERSQIRGLVLRPDGTPAVGAHVVVRSTMSPVRPGRFELEAATDVEGRFVLYGSAPWGLATVSVDGPTDCVRPMTFDVKGGADVNTLQLVAGATIRGRVLRNARPAEGVTVALSTLPQGPALGMPQVVTTPDSRLPRYTTTDALGRYAFEQVYPEREHQLFVPMTAVAKDNLFAHQQLVRTGGTGRTTEAAELNLHPAHRLSGQIITSNQQPLPAGTTVVLERTRVGDLQRAAVDGVGGFTFTAVPAESIVLSFHTPGNPVVPGYRLSHKNRSIDPTMATLCGRVDEDRQLLVLFEPGAARPYIAGETIKHKVAVGAGNLVVAQQVVVRNGRRVIVNVNHQPSSPHSRKLEPLAGVSEQDLPQMGVPLPTTPARR